VLFTRSILEGVGSLEGIEEIELRARGVQDIDGDGEADWLLSPTWFGGEERPRAAIVSGRDGAILSWLQNDAGLDQVRLLDRRGRMLGQPLFPPEAERIERRQGFPRLQIEDIDQDAVRDCVVGRYGLIQFVSGKDAHLIRSVHGDDGIRHVRCQGFGLALASLGDIDGDGISDIAVGAPDSGVAEGSVHIVSGRLGELLYDAPPDAGGWHWGHRLAALGDVDGDGAGDLAIASWHGFSREPGRAMVISGKRGIALTVLVRQGQDVRRDVATRAEPFHRR
jgi:hypothetical protein